MLILSRKEDETVVIHLSDSRQILIKVVNKPNGKVRLGFEAPDDVLIVRGEIEPHDVALRHLVKNRR